ncbi:SUMF1/EgtB/PvdO family nonheme iron enzyme [Streptomyces sp. NPDC058357]|uniref:SUMF1/EgtB/PvdO family nonheme iron enzyme n=1 Tax=unclassified Streptomyces TaxID=2593676 RepID=UPI0036667E94
MSAESVLRQVSAETMRSIPGREIVLRDEGTRTDWKGDVGAFRLAPYRRPASCTTRCGARAPGSPAGPRTPVTGISWNEAVRFCDLFSWETGLQPCYATGDDSDRPDVVCDWQADGYRFPSEAEWEYACRAGTSGSPAPPFLAGSRRRDFSGAAGSVHGLDPVEPVRQEHFEGGPAPDRSVGPSL